MEIIDQNSITLTKRNLLSIAAQIYDPAGTILGFPIFLFKHIFRDLTHNNPNMGWDEAISLQYQKWVKVH